MSDTVNMNFAICLRNVESWGMTHVHNVCAGTVTDIPWGLGGYASAVGIAVMILLGLAMAAMFGRMIFSDF